MRTMAMARAKAGTRLAWLLVVVCLMPGMTLAAEDTVSPAVGDRVRVRTVSGKRHVGELVSRDDTTLALKLSSAKNLVLARSDIARVDVSTSRSRRGKGAWVGAGVAAGIAAVLWLSTSGTGCYRGESPGPCPLVEKSVVSPFLLVASGAVFGALVAPGERWQPVPTERARVGLAPTRGRGVRVSIAFSF
jgi:hypothetical protein